MSTRALPPARPPAPPSPLVIPPVAAAAAFFAVACAVLFAWWDRIPVEPGFYAGWWQRDSRLLIPAWPGAALTWLANIRSLGVVLLLEIACLLAGRRALRWTLAATPVAGTTAALLALGLGNGILGTAVLGLGLAGLLSPAILGVVVASPLVPLLRRRAPRPARLPAAPAGGALMEFAGGPAVAAACGAVAAFVLAGLALGLARLLARGPLPDGLVTRLAGPDLLPFAAACGAAAGGAALLGGSILATRWATRAVIAAAAAFAGLNLLAAFEPEWFYDALVYHLAVPEQYLIEHKIVRLGHTFISNYPLLQEMRYTACLALGDTVAPRLLHWADGLGCAAVAAALAAPFTGAAGGWLAAALFLSTPSLLFLQQVSMVELGLAWFAGLALLAAVHGLGAMPGGRGGRGWILLAGWYLGLAQAVKYVGLNASVLVLGAVLLARRRGGARRTAADLVLAVAWASLWTGTWLAKNWAMTGNPLFPFFHARLGGLDWDASRQALWMGDNTKYGTGHGSAAAWLLMPALACTGSPGFGTIPLNPFPLLYLPLLLLVRGAPAAIRLCGAFAALGAVLWAVTTQEVRFLLPMLPPAAAAAAFVVRGAGAGAPPLRALLAASAAWILVASLHGAALNRNASDVFTPYTFGHLSRTGFLARALPAYDALQRANALVPRGRRLLFIGADESLYATSRRICDSIYDFSTLGRLAARSASPADLAARLRRLGVSHVLVDGRRCDEYLPYGLFAWPEAARRNVAGLIAAWLQPVYNVRRVGLFALTSRPAAPARAGAPSWLAPDAVARQAADLDREIEDHIQNGRMLQAAAACDRLLQLLPDDAQACVWRGLAYGQLNRVPEAMRDLASAARLGHPPASAVYNLGVYLAIRKQYARALPLFRAAGNLDPGLAASAATYATQVEAMLKR